MVKTSREELVKGLDRCQIPERMRPGILRWVEEGIKPGEFLSAIIINDLQETFARADDENIFRIHSYIKFFYNHTPSGCWGSIENAKEWASLFTHKETTTVLMEELDDDEENDLDIGE